MSRGGYYGGVHRPGDTRLGCGMAGHTDYWGRAHTQSRVARINASRGDEQRARVVRIVARKSRCTPWGSISRTIPPPVFRSAFHGEHGKARWHNPWIFRLDRHGVCDDHNSCSLSHGRADDRQQPDDRPAIKEKPPWGVGGVADDGAAGGAVRGGKAHSLAVAVERDVVAAQKAGGGSG